jgi:hypothetical protein
MTDRLPSSPPSVPANVVPDPEPILIAASKGIEQVRTKAADYSFNELFDMYLSNELLIDPAYQRAFRWSEEKQSQFIESLILELPIPPLYVMEVKDGQYELIDGLQRFSSYLHFRGELKKEGAKQPPLQLVGCDIVEELNGLFYAQLPTPLQIRIKRMTVPVQILRKESDTKARYHMFKRLNRGGEVLSDQEVRNATIRLLGATFNDFLRDLAQNPDFVACTEIMTDADKEQMAREECVLRFFAFKNDLSSYSKLIRPFLDSFMERVTDGRIEFHYPDERRVFEATFKIFAQTTGEQSFSSVGRNGALMNQFSQSHFDMLTLGIQKHLSQLAMRVASSPDGVKEQFVHLKKDPEFLKGVGGGGKNYQAAFKKNIALVESWVGKWLATA